MRRVQRKAIGKVLRSYRTRKGQTQQEVANALGWELPFYVQVERGRAGIDEAQQDDIRRMIQRTIQLLKPGKQVLHS